jgi:hypothetical protein
MYLTWGPSTWALASGYPPLFSPQHRSLTAISQKKVSSPSLVNTIDTRNRDREKSSGNEPRTEPQVNPRSSWAYCFKNPTTDLGCIAVWSRAEPKEPDRHATGANCTKEPAQGQLIFILYSTIQSFLCVILVQSNSTVQYSPFYVRSSYSTVQSKSVKPFLLLFSFFSLFLSLKFLEDNFQFWQRWLNFLFNIWQKHEEEADI